MSTIAYNADKYLTHLDYCTLFEKNSYLCKKTIQCIINKDSICEINLLLRNNNYQNCKLEIFQQKFDIRKLNDDYYVILAPSEVNVKEKCGEETTNVILYGSYLVDNVINCEYKLENQIIKIYQSKISGNVKFIDYQSKYQNITKLNVTSLDKENIVKELNVNSDKLSEIHFNQKLHTTNHIVTFIILIFVIIFLCSIICYVKRRFNQNQAKAASKIIDESKMFIIKENNPPII